MAPQLAPEQQAQAQQVQAQQVSWGSLGCPREIGLYRAVGGLESLYGNTPGSVQIRVKRIHIIVAEDDPGALFTVVALRPPLGPPEFVLGHRVA